MDTAGQGHVTFSEFLAAAMTSAEKFSEERLRLAFNAISKDGEGIKEENLRCTFGASREQDPQNFDEFCRNMISEYDNDDDGTLTFDEFSKIILYFDRLST